MRALIQQTTLSYFLPFLSDRLCDELLLLKKVFKRQALFTFRLLRE
jgi:hypothetical protein